MDRRVARAPPPQGHVYRSSTGKVERWFKPDWINLDHIPKTPVDLPLLKVRVVPVCSAVHVPTLLPGLPAGDTRYALDAAPDCLAATSLHCLQQTFIDAVVKRLMSDAPLAILLSGGLDSSLVASVAVRHIKEAKNAFDPDHKLHTYSIGIKGGSRVAVRLANWSGEGGSAGSFIASTALGRWLQALPTLLPRERWPTSSALCTTSSLLLWRRALTHCLTLFGTSSRTSRWSNWAGPASQHNPLAAHPGWAGA